MTPHSEVLLVDVLTTWITKSVALVPGSHAHYAVFRPFKGYLTGQFNLELNMASLRAVCCLLASITKLIL